ncbi:MAG TPA: hypothetical protein VE644_03050 [Gaiellaceae bacterium]|nr:hypothetical protein [Gaiellaceae bacterium]
MQILLLLIVSVALAAGCGVEGDARGEPPGASGGLVLQVEQRAGGPLPPGPAPASLTLALYADGRVFRPDPVPAIYPGPALPTFSVSRISRERVEDVLADVRAAGILDPEPEETVPDGGVTVVTAVVDGEPRTVGLPNGSGVALRFERALRGLPPFGERRYDPHALAMLAIRVDDVLIPDHDFEPMPTTFPWPAGELAPGCAIVRGPELERVLADAGRANQLTRWRSGGALYAVAFRPLLPGESSCADVAA